MGERLAAWRNALYASARFQRWASRNPLTRRVGRAHARRLFDLVAGFGYSQALFACVELELFDRLAAGPMAVDALAAAVEVPNASLERLVDAAVALDLLEQRADGRVALGVAGAELRGNPGVAAMIAHHRHFYADLADPVALLRRPGSGELAAFWRYAEGRRADAVAGYSALMAASLTPVAAQLLDAYDVRRHRRLLDIGGGEGRFLAAVRDRAPALALGLFDLPAVCARAQAQLAGLSLHPGDFRHDPLPEGYDCMSLVRVLHDHDDDIAAALLRSIRSALPPGGRLLIVEPMAEAPGAARVGAYFSLYLLAMGTGRPRSAHTIRAMLGDAGFAGARPLRTAIPLHAGAIVAHV